MSEEKLKAAKIKKLELLERKRKRESELPHLYGFPWYEWAWSFFTTKNKMALLTASNQSGKSSTQIRKVIHLATAVEEWPQWWDHRPKQFWWLYPNKHVATVEFYQKWVPEFLPRGSMVTDPQYGWQAEFDQAKKISEIRFNTGVSIYFRSYETDVAALQSGTVDYIACFTGDTLVSTSRNLQRIEDIAVGDQVKTHLGLRKVNKLTNRDAYVIKRMFSDGSYIEATPEHLFYTINRGWVAFSELNERDELCQVEELPQGIENVLSTEERSSIGRKITDTATLKKALAEEVNSCTELFGKSTMVRFQKARIYTTLMRILKTIELKTLLLYPWKNTIKLTKSLEALLQRLSNVLNVRLSLAQSLGTIRISTAQLSVEEVQEQLNYSARTAEKSLTEYVSIYPIKKKHVLPGVLGIGIRKVHCLKVDEAKTFFANGVLVHNCDEELDSALYSELQFRTVATNGYFSLVFTATKGQEFWRLAIEPKEGEKENFPLAWKRQVSMYDCMYYRDGKPGKFTPERIDEIKAACKSQAEIARRVYGKFVLSDNMAFPWFSEERHHKYVGNGNIPDTWDIYAASDLGSGNFSTTSHPAALVFVGVNPERTRGRVFRAWRGDDVNTTAGDVYDQYKQMCVTIGRDPISKSYDYESADFGIVVERAGDFWYRAEKNVIRGQELVNSLFKYDVLTLDEGDSEIDKMSAELQNVSKDGGKDQRDDLVSCLRYCIMKIPWDWERIRGESKKDDRPKSEEPEKEPTDREIQREKMLRPPKAVDFGVEEEMEFWQEMFD